MTTFLVYLMIYELVNQSDLNDFEARCEQRERRATLSTFGLDLMIDTEGGIHCIEVNGNYSGTAGFKQAYGNDFVREAMITHLLSYDLPVTLLTTRHNFDIDVKKFGSLPGLTIEDIEAVRLDTSKRCLGNVNMSDIEYYTMLQGLSDSENDIFQKMHRKLFFERVGRSEHHGSIRYIVTAESGPRGVDVHHFGGYVRLAPKPLGDSLESCVANLTKGAEAIPLSNGDLLRIKKWVDMVLPIFYRQVLRMKRFDSLSLVNYMNPKLTKKLVNEPWRWIY